MSRGLMRGGCKGGSGWVGSQIRRGKWQRCREAGEVGWRRNDQSFIWNLVLCLTWFSGSTRNVRPLRLANVLSGYWQEEGSFFFFFDKLHTAATCLSLRQPTSIARQSHQLAWSHPLASTGLWQHLLLFDWRRDGSVYPSWRRLFFSVCCSYSWKAAAEWFKGRHYMHSYFTCVARRPTVRGHSRGVVHSSGPDGGRRKWSLCCQWGGALNQISLLGLVKFSEKGCEVNVGSSMMWMVEGRRMWSEITACFFILVLHPFN